MQQRARFISMRTQKNQIRRNIFQRVHLQAPRNSAQHRRALVMRKIMTGLRGRITQGFPKRRFIIWIVRLTRRNLSVRRSLLLGRFFFFVSRSFRRQLNSLLVLDKLYQLRWHLFCPQHPIHHPGIDGRTRHCVVLRLGRILRHGHAALRLDVLQSNYSVRIGPRKQHANRALPVSLCQRAKKKINCDPLPRRLLRLP